MFIDFVKVEICLHHLHHLHHLHQLRHLHHLHHLHHLYHLEATIVALWHWLRENFKNMAAIAGSVSHITT